MEKPTADWGCKERAVSGAVNPENRCRQVTGVTLLTHMHFIRFKSNFRRHKGRSIDLQCVTTASTWLPGREVYYYVSFPNPSSHERLYFQLIHCFCILQMLFLYFLIYFINQHMLFKCFRLIWDSGHSCCSTISTFSFSVSLLAEF